MLKRQNKKLHIIPVTPQEAGMTARMFIKYLSSELLIVKHLNIKSFFNSLFTIDHSLVLKMVK
jgi:hypothetical protein